MRLILIAAVLLPLMSACAVDNGGSRSPQARVEPAAPTQRTYALGTELTPEGAVAMRSTGDTFVRGGAIYLSVDVSSASVEQRVAVEWRTAEGALVARAEKHVPQAARYVAFESGATEAWPVGDHRATVTIDGRKVTELEFTLM